MNKMNCELCACKLIKDPNPESDELICECGSRYAFNEGFMLCAHWATAEIKQLRMKIIDYQMDAAFEDAFQGCVFDESFWSEVYKMREKHNHDSA